MRSQRMTARESPGGEPAAANDAVPLNGLGGVIGAAGQKPARAAEIRPEKQLIGADYGQRRPHAQGVV